MKKTTLACLVATLTLGASSTVFAQEDVFRGRFGVAYGKYTTLFSGGEIKADAPLLSIGGTYINKSGYFVDLGIKQSMNAKWNTIETQSTHDGHDEKARKTDYTLTIGKALGDGWSVFGGYQYVHTIADIPSAWNRTPDETFNVKGYFAGLGKSFQVGPGSLSLSAAYGQMKGKLKNSLGEWYSSDTGNGYSVGAAYSYYFDKNWGVVAEVKQQKYSYKYPPSQMIITTGDDKVTAYGLSLVRNF